MQFGRRVNGRLEAVFQANLKATKPKEIFQLDIETQGVADEELAIQQLLTLEEEVADLKILFIETKPDGTIAMQFTDTGPGDISIGGLFSLIPAVALVVGIVIVGYLLWQVYTGPTSWLIVPLAIAGGIVALYLIVGTKVAEVFKPEEIRTTGKEKDDTLKERIKDQKAILTSERTTIKTGLTEARESEKNIRNDLESIALEENRLRESKKITPQIRERLTTIERDRAELGSALEEAKKIQTAYQNRLEVIRQQEEALGKVI